jgi:pimeloyl-ACP methyl ester carboxylesterase
VAVSLIGLAFAASAQTLVTDIPLAGGGEKMLFASAANPRAIAFVFAGGDGTVTFNAAGQPVHMAGNFLLRTQALWQAQGFAYVTLASSSSLMGRRHTPAYAELIGHAIDVARSRANIPVWLIGTSMRSIAAANGAAHLPGRVQGVAAHLPGRVQGVVLTSSVAGQNRDGETVFDSDLGAIAVPALIVSNRGDTCPSAGAGFAPQILAGLARAPRKEIIYVESHQLQSDPCEAMSPHGYLGIEADVVQRISDWIRAAGGR